MLDRGTLVEIKKFRFGTLGSVRTDLLDRTKGVGKNFLLNTSFTFVRKDLQQVSLLHFVICNKYFDTCTWLSSWFVPRFTSMNDLRLVALSEISTYVAVNVKSSMVVSDPMFDSTYPAFLNFSNSLIGSIVLPLPCKCVP